MSLNFAKLRKTKSIEFIGVGIAPFICMSGTPGDGDDRARGNRHAVGKCERTQRETGHGDWEEMRANQYLVLEVLRRESNERGVTVPSRWVSRRKLSILSILSIPAFVQPSSLRTASTSSRRGPRYSGLARRRYKICVIVCWHATIRNV